jgi:hypothetical protein
MSCKRSADLEEQPTRRTLDLPGLGAADPMAERLAPSGGTDNYEGVANS